MASIYLRGRVWWCSYLDHGVKHCVSLKTRDKQVARFKKNEIEISLIRGQSPLPDSTITAQEAFSQFRKSRHGRIVDKTAQTDDYRIERFLKESNVAKLPQITEGKLKEHLDNRIEGGISHRTANHTIRIIKTFLNWAVKSKMLSTNPISHMRRYKVERQEPRFLSPQEVAGLLTRAKESRGYLVIAIATYTGMRQGEILRLRWEDIDFENQIITVRLSKSGQFRKIPLHKDLSKILCLQRADGRIFQGTPKMVEWDFKRVAPAGYRFHDLRHTFASLLIKSGVDIYTVSKILGHSQVSTTQIYAHLYSDHVQDAVAKLRI